MRWSIVLLLMTLFTAGCTGGDDDASVAAVTQQGLDLRLQEGEATVGKTATFHVQFAQTDGSALFGAMIADDSQANVTRWHAEPADAVKFDPTTSKATFTRAGPVRIWATYTGPDGAQFKSNELALTIGG